MLLAQRCRWLLLTSLRMGQLLRDWLLLLHPRRHQDLLLLLLLVCCRKGLLLCIIPALLC